MQVPLLDLRAQYDTLREEILPLLAEICDSQQFILGAYVEGFEKACAHYLGVKHAIGVSSGSDAELVTLMALGYGPGDTIITTPYTFFATVGSMVRLGVRPWFADIDPLSYQIDPARVEALLKLCTRRGRDGALMSPGGSVVRAIMPVHLFGTCVDMAAIRALAEEYRLPIIEDAAQAFGTRWPAPGQGDAPSAGTLGVAGFYSFYPSKNLGGFGDGGLVVCEDDALAARLRAMRNHGMTQRYHHTMLGGNFRLDGLQAGVLTVKLRHLDDWSAARRSRAALYREAFTRAGVAPEHITLPAEPFAESGVANHHIYHQYVIRVHGGRRDALRQHLLDHGIGCEVYYPVPVHRQECFSEFGYEAGSFPEAEKAAAETLALPIFPELTDDQVRKVVAAVEQKLG